MKLRRLLVLFSVEPRVAMSLVLGRLQEGWRKSRGRDFYRGSVRLGDSWRLRTTGLEGHIVASWVSDEPEPSITISLPYPEGRLHSACYGQRWSYLLSDVVLDVSTGAVVANDHLIAESLRGSAQSSEYWGSLIIATTKALRRCRRPKRVISSPSTALPVFDVDVYGHFLLYALPNILRCRNACSETLTVLAPKGTPMYIFEALNAAGVDIEVVTEPTRAVSFFLAASAYVNSGDIYGSDIELLRATFLRSKVATETNPPMPIRIYASRSRDARGRGVPDEEALCRELEGLGFLIYHGGEMSFLEQAALFRQAELLVAPTGSGLTNMVWMDPGAHVVELGNPELLVAHEVATAARKLNVEYRYINVLNASGCALGPRELASLVANSA